MVLNEVNGQPLVHVPNSGQKPIPLRAPQRFRPFAGPRPPNSVGPRATCCGSALAFPGPSLRFLPAGFCGRSFLVNEGSGVAIACVPVSVAATSRPVVHQGSLLSISLPTSGNAMRHWIAIAFADAFRCSVATCFLARSGLSLALATRASV